jgi:hypothetical protein
LFAISTVAPGNSFTNFRACSGVSVRIWFVSFPQPPSAITASNDINARLIIVSFAERPASGAAR